MRSRTESDRKRPALAELCQRSARAFGAARGVVWASREGVLSPVAGRLNVTLTAICAANERAGGLDLGLHVSELVADRLKAGDRTAEGGALLGVARRDVERRLRDAHGLRGDPDAPAVERRQRDPHAAAWRPEALGRRV